ncbi:MAG: cell division protein FtsL [Asticcacaulis sp.]
MNAIIRLFEQRVRGFRLIELVGILLSLVMVFWVCLSKAREGEDIKRMNDLDARIAEQQQTVDALKVKVAGLEKPARLESLAVAYLGMKPVAPTHEAKLDALAEISRATSQPVAATASGPANAPVAGPTAAAQGELITTVPVKPAAPSPAIQTAKTGGAL